MFDKLWLYLGIAIAAIGAFFGIRAKIRSDAIDEERARQQQEVLNAAKQRKEIEQRIDVADPTDIDKYLQHPKRK